MSCIILGIETSCDDTGVAVVDAGDRVLANVLSSQTQLHADYGGVVPELASRGHSENIVHVFRGALQSAGIGLDDVDLIAVTRGPGLIGCLLVGVMVAKGLSWSTGTPVVGVNHLKAHVWASVLDRTARLAAPALCLIVSGGHTELLLVEEPDSVEGTLVGGTRDDAAGEAFDKVARLLGLGYPGGPVIDRLAAEYRGDLIDFPRPMLSDSSFDFSFSGLKTAVAVYLEERDIPEGRLSDEEQKRVAASFQEAVVEVLATKAQKAIRETGVRTLIAAGGVAANRQLRRRLRDLAGEMGVEIIIPPPKYCTDNAAMVAAAGYRRFLHHGDDGMELDANPSLSIRPVQR